MIRADRADDAIEVAAPAYLAKKIKEVPGARWRKATERWALPLSWVSCLLLRERFGDDIEVGDALREWSWREFERLDRLRQAREAALDPTADCEGDPRLRPFQRTGVAWLRIAGDAILGDDMGTGKTVMLSSILADREGPHLVVAPKGALRPWARHVTEWPGVPLDPAVIAGSAAKRRKQLEAALDGETALRVLIMTLDTLKQHTRYAAYGATALVACVDCGGLDAGVKPAYCEVHPRELSAVEWGTVIVDEAHKILNPRSKQTRACWWVGRNAERRLGATGTPIDETPDEFWSLLHDVAPHEWPSRTKYIDQWCQVTLSFFGGFEEVKLRPDRAEQFHTLKDQRFLRRPKALVAPHLPRKTEVARVVTMPPKQAKVYNDLAYGMLADIDGGQLASFNGLSQGARLSQAAAASLELDEVGTVRLTEPSPKLDELMDVLEESGDQPLGVLSASRQLLDLAAARLDKAGIRYARFVGGMSDIEQEEQKELYNTGRVRVVLLLLGVGAEAISFTRGSLVVFLSRSWQRMQNEQAIDRWHGIGRGDEGAEALTIVDIVTAGTVEEYMLERLAEKAEGHEALVRDRDTLRAALAWKGLQ